MNDKEKEIKELKDKLSQLEESTNSDNKKEDNIFLGCMFVWIGLGFVFDNVVAGTLIGMGVGFIIQQFLSKWRDNSNYVISVNIVMICLILLMMNNHLIINMS